ncbi:uncharacterized protein LTR77_007484 [Saxophila tyrrhenica]|uniref:Uncharacterized protein n=1 Tax=Saxophila tyrrhenica TaxID=1690608 RepID=A0AAV9P8Y2_9PEZI|nr:hypothetical protein LTR77_007484 [Saxophila tyrrhenica]
MAEASSSRRPYTTSPPEDSSPSEDDRGVSETSSRRRTHYGGQRVSRSTRPSTSETQKSAASRRKRASYQEPLDYSNLDEEAIPPPVKAEDWKTQNPPSRLEENIRQSRAASGSKHGSNRNETVRRRRSRNDGEEELTEVAAPPPASRTGDREAATGAEQSLEEDLQEEDVSEESRSWHRQRQPEELLRRKDEPAKTSKFLTELYTISYLVFFAILGTLARLGVQWITFYPGTPMVTPVIWANFGGSFVLGFLAEDQRMFRDNSSSSSTNGTSLEMQHRNGNDGKEANKPDKAEATKRKKAIPLYIGLATGFCGSFTSFSSFTRDVFLALSNDLPTPIDHPYQGSAPPVTSTISRNGGYSFEALLHVIIATLALSLGGLVVGAQFAAFLDPITPRIHGSFIRKFVDPAMVILGFGCWLGAVFLAIWPPANAWRGEVVFALVFAPVGCLLRFYASMKLNGLVPAFPLGTFAVNMLGMCYDIQHVGVGVMGRIGGGMIGCQILNGVQDGFCGCLTTISTWVAEINGLKRKHGWGYAFGSVLGGFCLMVVIMGSVRWSVGSSSPVCDTGYTSKVHG